MQRAGTYSAASEVDRDPNSRVECGDSRVRPQVKTSPERVHLLPSMDGGTQFQHLSRVGFWYGAPNMQAVKVTSTGASSASKSRNFQSQDVSGFSIETAAPFLASHSTRLSVWHATKFAE